MHPILISPLLLVLLVACPILLSAIVVLCGFVTGAFSSGQALTPARLTPSFGTTAGNPRGFWAVISLMTGALVWLTADLVARVLCSLP